MAHQHGATTRSPSRPISGPQRWKQGRLHFAFAERLTGPWCLHSDNPVRSDLASSRPGGTAWLENGVPHLPVQDCTRTYGGALRVLKILELSPGHFEAEATTPLLPPASAEPIAKACIHCRPAGQ